MRVVIAEDMALLREGLSRLLGDAGFDVVGEAPDLPGLLKLVTRTAPDAALIDIKMPPTHTDEGLQAAAIIRRQHPGTAVLLLSSYLESRYASALLAQNPASSGYLLKECVYDSAVLSGALERVHRGECVIDAAIISQLLSRNRIRGPLDDLTDREREILALMAEGHSNHSICSRLVISPRTVESHVRNVFMKLGIAESADTSRRVIAVLAFLQALPETAARPRMTSTRVTRRKGCRTGAKISARTDVRSRGGPYLRNQDQDSGPLNLGRGACEGVDRHDQPENHLGRRRDQATLA